MTIGLEISENHVCLECGTYICKNRLSLGSHLMRSHPDVGGIKGYVLKHVLHGITPKCKCGCGREVKWHRTMYHFNDYVTGHNPSNLIGYVHTSEQIDKRNECIRLSYENNGEKIRKKISASLVEANKHDDVKHRYSEGRKRYWTPENRAKHSISQKKAWKKDHDARVSRVFTPEFCKRISEANMARDVKMVSNLELRLVNELKQTFPSIVGSKWFNFSERTWCADAWIPERKAIVELDGVFWHGLDRDRGFTYKQVECMLNDARKNMLAVKKRLSLIRIAIDDSTSFLNVRDFDDLVELSYFAVFDGEVLKSDQRLFDVSCFEFCSPAVDLLVESSAHFAKFCERS